MAGLDGNRLQLGPPFSSCTVATVVSWKNRWKRLLLWFSLPLIIRLKSWSCPGNILFMREPQLGQMVAKSRGNRVPLRIYENEDNSKTTSHIRLIGAWAFGSSAYL